MLKYCCRECEKVLGRTKCENLCPDTWEIRKNINKLPANRCTICNYQGCNDFRPFKEDISDYWIVNEKVKNMKIPKTAKKAIENSKLMYELIYQEKLIDKEIEITHTFPSRINTQILKFWKALDGDTQFLIQELYAIDKASKKVLTIDEFKNEQRYFLTSLILHSSIVDKSKFQNLIKKS